MIRRIGLAIGLFALLAPASAQKAPEQRLWMQGVGQQSYLFWIANPRADNDVRLWLIGYWTGMNRINEQNHKPGSTTTGYGEFGYARKACLEQPTKLISDVAAELYARTITGWPITSPGFAIANIAISIRGAKGEGHNTSHSRVAPPIARWPTRNKGDGDSRRTIRAATIAFPRYT
jgi:hypothetical protein